MDTVSCTLLTPETSRMRLSTRLPRLAAVTAGLGALVATAALAAVPASAANGGTPATSVTVFLTAPNPSALAALAGETGLSVGQRRAALARLLPDDAAHQAVADSLRAEGLTVTDETAWSVTASGPTGTVASSFGDRPALPAHATAAQVKAATGALPAVPASLSPLVSAAFPSTGGPAAFHAANDPSLSGPDFRNAYTAPSVSPDTGSDPTTPLTIATVQLSSWDPSDLSGYAAEHGLTLGQGQLTQVQIGNGPGSDYSGEGEVDLDQESILSTDPYANQRAYFATNTEAGNGVAAAQVLDDVLQDSHAAGGGDPHIAALSTSWGDCESRIGKSTITKVIEPELESLVVAGVTIFAASGDNGIYDCGPTLSGSTVIPTTAAGVDYPASSPNVVGVGGTTLAAAPAGSAGSPNTGSNWAESGWSCTSPTSCEVDVNGPGGGASSIFPEPTYQSVGIGNSTYTDARRRLVPDIAADGNPASGFTLHTGDTSPDGPCDGETDCTYGGTSLGSPTSAALFTTVLAQHGAVAGVGDIHPALYSAFAATKSDAATDPAKAFRDITAGSNGATKTKGSDPSVYAASGYDTASGLGGALWPALGRYLFSPAAPSARDAIALRHPDSRHRPTAVTATWAGRQSATGLLVGSTDVTIAPRGSRHATYHAGSAPASGSHTFTAKPGVTYVVTARARDLKGQLSSVATSTVTVPIDAAALGLHGSWQRRTSSSDVAGSHVTTTTAGSYARVGAKGQQYSVVVRTGPSFGKLAIYLGAKRVRTVDEYSRHNGHETVSFFGGRHTPRRHRVFQLRYAGAKNARSSSTTVDVDAVSVTY
jgi:kumamolisin